MYIYYSVAKVPVGKVAKMQNILIASTVATTVMAPATAAL